MIRAGIDLGGTKIEIIALDEHGRALMRHRVETPRGDYQATIEAVAALLHHCRVRVGDIATVGIGTPGAVSNVTGRIKNSNSTCLNRQPLKQDLEAALGRPVSLANDANCFALSEATDGAGKGAATVFGVILGTGTGGALVVDGKVLTGANGIAGEWGHNPLPWPHAQELPGPRCYCGRHGCIETWLSGPALSRDHATPGTNSLPAIEIARLADKGDSHALQTLQRYEQRLARALASVINIFDPEVIVLGGGLSNIERLYTHVPALWADFVFSDTVDTRLLPPVHGDSSGVRGAAWLPPSI